MPTIKTRKIIIKSLFSFIFYAVILCFYSFSFAQDKIIAIVNEDAITQSDVENFINSMRLQLSSQYEKAELEGKIESMRPDLLNKLIEDRLILQEAKKAEISVNENMVKAKINEIKKNFRSEAEFQYALKSEGLAQSDLEGKIRDQMTMYGIIDYKIKNQIVVTPIEITAFYEANKEKFETPAKREFTYLVFSDEKIAGQFYNLLKNTPDTEKTIYENSLDVNKISFSEGEELKKEIAQAVEGLDIGEITSPFKVENKYYIFKFDKVIPSQQKSLAESQEGILSFLFDQKMQEELTKWIEKLKSEAYIKIL